MIAAHCTARLSVGGLDTVYFVRMNGGLRVTILIVACGTLTYVAEIEVR
jgi:hypothetical protein